MPEVGDEQPAVAEPRPEICQTLLALQHASGMCLISGVRSEVSINFDSVAQDLHGKGYSKMEGSFYLLQLSLAPIWLGYLVLLGVGAKIEPLES